MTESSVYERVLGRAFDDLDPLLRTYFGPIPAGFVGVGVGRFREAGLRVRALRPVFVALGIRGLAFAEYGVDIPFTVRNVSGSDGVLHATRTFHFPAVDREMTDAMHVAGGNLVDRVGNGGEVEVELVTRVSDGKLLIESRRLALRMLGLRVPVPPLVKITLEEWAERGQEHVQRVRVSVTAPILGEIYGYEGSFTYSVEPITTNRATHSSVGLADRIESL